MSEITMCIGADVVPTESSVSLFIDGGKSLLEETLRCCWEAADLRVVNLECPLYDGNAPISKCGMHLGAPEAAVRGLAGLSLDAVSLANNHILDHGEPGLTATLNALSGAGIPAFGAGRNAAEADEPLYLAKNGMRIGLYAVCEHEFSCAEADAPGANGLDELVLSDRIRTIRADCDRLVVLYHGGREYYPYPSPRLQKRCRRMVACGADAVLCQHSHCIGSQETYLGRPIVYGQGNFLFDMDDEPCFKTGLVVQLIFTEDEVRTNCIPIERYAHGAARLTGDAASAVLCPYNSRSAQIAEPGWVEAHYRAYAAEYREKMLKVFLSGNPALRILCRLYGRKPTRVYSRAARLAMQNAIACESLRELIEAGLPG